MLYAWYFSAQSAAVEQNEERDDKAVYALCTRQKLKHEAVAESVRLLGYNARRRLTGLANAYSGAYAGEQRGKRRTEQCEEIAIAKERQKIGVFHSVEFPPYEKMLFIFLL